MNDELSPKSSLQKLASLLAETKEKAVELVTESENQVILTSVVSALQKTLNRVNFLAGITHSIHHEAPEFEPIVLTADSAPIPEYNPDDERKAYMAKVEHLFSQFHTLSPDGIVNDFRTPDDELVIRGVAKRAGVANFESREFNVSFIEAIQKAIEKRLQDDEEAARIEAELKAQELLTSKGAGTGTDTPDADEADDDFDAEFSFDFGDEGLESQVASTTEDVAPELNQQAPEQEAEPAKKQQPQTGRKKP